MRAPAVRGHSSNAMTRFLLILVLVFSGVGSAAVTAAWKVPIGSRIPHHETDGKVRKLDKPPDESAFFEAGDELWEVSKALTWEVAGEENEEGDPFADPAAKPIKVGWKGDWLVWNARSRMFIARGTWSQILLVGDVLGFEAQPIVLRSRFEVVEGSDNDDTKPGKVRSLSIACRSNASARTAVDGFEAEVGGTALGLDGISEMVYSLSWPAKLEDRRWEIGTGILVHEEVRTRLARQGEGPDSWEAWVTVSRELLDGTPFSESRWIETAEGIERWKLPEPGKRRFRKALGQSREIGIYPVSKYVLARLVGIDVMPTLPDRVPPDGLTEWVRGPLIDLGKALRAEGVKFDDGAGHFAGLDPRSRSVIMVADATNQDLANGIFWDGSRGFHPLVWIETNPKSGGWGMMCRSGEKAAIRQVAGEVAAHVFEVQPTLGSVGDVMDLRYNFDVVAGDRAMGRVEAAATLTIGKQVKVLTSLKDGAEDLEVVLTATVMGE